MDYEKKYKKAFERANEYHFDGAKQCIIDTLEYIFPELKESKDERIRKGIKSILEHYKESGEVVCPYPFVSIDEALAWLEKQGEQKPIIDGILTATNYDKMFQNCNVHKFNIGDWVISTLPGIKYPHLITDVRDGYYIFGEDDDYAHIASNDNILKLWTIQDAKDGDILAFDNETIVIFKDLYNTTTFHSYCHVEKGVFSVSKGDMPDRWACKWFHPATKEQYNTLFAKMKEAGYEWDTENKQLKKISQRMISAEAKEAMYDKPTDLEVFINELSKQFPDVSFAKLSRIAVRVAKWAKPTDEEMKELFRTEYEKGRADAIAERLKHTWSEEDKRILDALITSLTNEHFAGRLETLKGIGVPLIIDWLKSLKERCTWKPDEEQLKAIKWIMDGDNPENWTITLTKLYNDLKKL